MSGLLMGLVYYHQFTPRQQKVLLALADHGKDDGTSIHPSLETLAWKTGSDRRNIQRTLRSLEDMGVLVPVAYAGGGRGHPTEYVMRLDRAPLRPSPPPSSGMQRIYDMLKGGAGAAVYDDEAPPKSGDPTTLSPKTHKGRRSTRIKGGDPRIKGGDPRIKGGSIAARTINKPSENHQEETAHARDTSLDDKIEAPEPEPEPDPSPRSAAPLPATPTLYGAPLLGANHLGFQRWLSLLTIPTAEKYQPARRRELMNEYFAAANAITESAEVTL